MRFSVLPVTLACLLLAVVSLVLDCNTFRLLLELDWDISPCRALLYVGSRPNIKDIQAL